MPQLGHCSYLTHYGTTMLRTIEPTCFGRCDAYLRKSLLDSYEVSSVELRATIGRQIVSKLPAHFRLKNSGRFIAVDFTGKVLAVCDTLESLNKEIVEKKIRVNYYIERIGYSEIAQV